MEVSNRLLVYIIAVAIFFSLFSIVSIMDKLGTPPSSLITGMQTTANATGKVNITIANVVSITLATDSIDFGNGSNAGGVQVNTSTSANPNTFRNPGGFQLRHDGNVDVNVSINGSTATQFITTGTSPTYQWAGSNVSSAADSGCPRPGNLTTTITTMNNTPALLCQNFTFRDPGDLLNTSIYLFIPADTTAATYTDAVVRFYAERYP